MSTYVTSISSLERLDQEVYKALKEGTTVLLESAKLKIEERRITELMDELHIDYGFLETSEGVEITYEWRRMLTRGELAPYRSVVDLLRGCIEKSLEKRALSDSR